MLSALGGPADTAIGAVVTLTYSMYQGWPLVIPGLAVLGGLAGAIVVGTAAGPHPSMRAARPTPTEALAAA